MKITVGMFTTKEDYCIIGYPKMHMFEYLVQSLRKQTYKNIELVIADSLYETRKDYFKGEDFPIKHVPMKPNIWIDNGYWAISASRNTCIMHATGDAIMLLGDATAIEPDCIERAVRLFDVCDASYLAFKIHNGDDLIKWGMGIDAQEGLGYSGFTCKIDWLEKANGYDEFFDGSKGFEDGDMPIRLAALGAKIKFNRTPMTIQQHTASKTVTKVACCIRRREEVIYNRRKEGIIVNTVPLRPEELDFMYFCGKYKNGVCINGNKCLYNDDPNIQWYTDPSFQFSLKKQREEYASIVP